MPGTAANPSPFDPLDEMEPDEPRFVLRGKDHAAPGAITEWSRLRRNKALHDFNKIEEPTEKDRLALSSELSQCREADDRAMEMQDWRLGQAKPEGDGRASYNDIERTQEQLAELARKKRLEGLLRHVQEGRFHLAEVRDGLLDMGLISGETAAEITQWLDRAQQVADEHDPRQNRFKSQPTLALPPASSSEAA